MAIVINDSIVTNAPKSIDDKYLKNGVIPYISIAQVIAEIPQPYRYIGLTVLISLAGGAAEYWWIDSTEDSDLVVKVPRAIPQSSVSNLEQNLATINTSITSKASLDSPVFTGSPTSPNPDIADNSTRLATTAFVKQVAAGGSSGVSSVNGKSGAVTLTKTDIGLALVNNTTDAQKPVSTAQQAAFDLKANITNPGFLGIPTAPTAAAGTNTTQIATTAFVKTAIDSIPGATTDATVVQGSTKPVTGGGVYDALALKANLASPTFTGVVTLPAPPAGDNSLKAATTAFVKAEIAAIPASGGGNTVTVDPTIIDGSINPPQGNAVFDALALKANLSGATFTGTLLAPTPASGDSSTRVATTAFIENAMAGITGVNVSSMFVHVKDFGAVGDGTDEGVKIQKALDNGTAKIVIFQRGKTYVSGQRLYVPSGVTVIGNGAIIKPSSTLTLGLAIAFLQDTTGGVTDSTTGSGIVLTAGKTTFTYANAAALTLGQILQINGPVYDTSLSDGSDYSYGLLTRVVAISGTTVTVDIAPEDTFTSVSLARNDIADNIHITGLTIDLRGKTNGAGIALTNASNSTIEDCIVLGDGGTAAMDNGIVATGVNLRISGNVIKGVRGGTPPDYGIAVTGNNIIVERNYVETAGHCITSAGRAYKSAGIIFRNNITRSTSNARSHSVDFHGNASGVIEGNLIYSDRSGIAIRGKHVTCRNNQVFISPFEDFRFGIGFGEEGVEGIVIENNRIRITPNGASSFYGICVSNKFQSPARNIHIIGNDIQGSIVFSASVENEFDGGLVIRNNFLRPVGTAYPKIDLLNVTQDVNAEISENTFEYPVGIASSYAMQIKGGPASSVRISRNKFHMRDTNNVSRPIQLYVNKTEVIDNIIYGNGKPFVADSTVEKENYIMGNRGVSGTTWRADVYTALPPATAWMLGRTITYQLSATTTANYICVQTGSTTYAWQKVTTA